MDPKTIGICIVLGSAVGALLGMGLGDVFTGAGLGIAVGTCIGVALDYSRGKGPGEDPPDRGKP